MHVCMYVVCVWEVWIVVSIGGEVLRRKGMHGGGESCRPIESCYVMHRRRVIDDGGLDELSMHRHTERHTQRDTETPTHKLTGEGSLTTGLMSSRYTSHRSYSQNAYSTCCPLIERGGVVCERSIR